ncbi:MAG: hypothetical protein AB7F86_00430 [Bdellovibrionales bacterium]
MIKWVVSYFEPFDSARSNSSQILAERLKGQLSGIEFVGPLPVSFEQAWPVLQNFVQQHNPSIGILALGQAESRRKISLEMAALNRIDARISDNQGNQPRLIPVRNGPDLLWSKIQWAKFPENSLTERSYSAGTFVCNSLMYEICHYCMNSELLGGFVHIPLLDFQSEPQFEGLPKVSTESAVETLRDVLQFLCRPA